MMDFQGVNAVFQAFWPTVAGGIACYVAIRADLASLKTRLDHFEKEQERHYNRLNDIERRSGHDRRTGA